MVTPAAAITARPIRQEDAEAVAALSGELGYPVSVDAMARRIATLSGDKTHLILVACTADGAVVGWIDVLIAHHLQSDPHGEIGGLVVSESVRSSGIGRLLVKQAEDWVRGQGIGSTLVRSQLKRERAHRFYEREGYTRLKTSAVFTKSLE